MSHSRSALTEHRNANQVHWKSNCVVLDHASNPSDAICIEIEPASLIHVIALKVNEAIKKSMK